MRMNGKVAFIISCVTATSLMLSACNFGGGDTTGNTGKTLIMTQTAELPNLGISTTADAASFVVLNNTMEGLMRLDKDSKPTLGMAAEAPKLSEDKKTYTFKLRDAKWSDGVEIKAQDFEYSWKRTLDPKTASQYAYILYFIKGAEAYNSGKGSVDQVGVKAINDKTLEVTLEVPTPYFESLLAFTTYLPQRKDIVEKYGNQYAKEADKLVYNGPFKLTAWNHSSSYTMKKNENYWDKDTVKLDTVETKIIIDTASSVNLYNTNQVDFTYLTQDFTTQFKGKPDYQVIPEATVAYLDLNHTNKLFKNLKIRKAIDMAIDKKTLVEKVMKDASTPAYSIIPPNINANDSKKVRELVPQKETYNSAEAKKLWSEGLKELGMTKAPVISLVGDDRDTAKIAMEYLKDQLTKAFGAEIEITSVPFKQRLKRAENGEFDMVLYLWNADYNDPMTFLDIFETNSSFNNGKWSNAEFDALIKKSKTNSNFEERAQDLIKAEQLALNEMIIIPLYHRNRVAAVKPYVKGIVYHAIGAEYDLKWADIEKK